MVLGHDLMHDLCSGHDGVDAAADLPDLQLAFIQVALEHSPLGTSPPEQILQGIFICATRIRGLYLIEEFVPDQSHRCQLLQRQDRFSLSRIGHALFEVEMGG